MSLPYATLECIFNHKNLWVSREERMTHVLDPAGLEYNLHDAKRWEVRLTSISTIIPGVFSFLAVVLLTLCLSHLRTALPDARLTTCKPTRRPSSTAA